MMEEQKGQSYSGREMAPVGKKEGLAGHKGPSRVRHGETRGLKDGSGVRSQGLMLPSPHGPLCSQSPWRG